MIEDFTEIVCLTLLLPTSSLGLWGAGWCTRPRDHDIGEVESWSWKVGNAGWRGTNRFLEPRYSIPEAAALAQKPGASELQGQEKQEPREPETEWKLAWDGHRWIPKCTLNGQTSSDAWPSFNSVVLTYQPTQNLPVLKDCFLGGS